MKYKKIVIIGMGLIGGSVGKALIKKGLAEEVVGVCRRESSLQRAINEKSLTKGYVNNYGEAAKGADMIFIATPVNTIKEVLKELAKVVKSPTIVTDVGSTKAEIAALADKYAKKFSFIGAHPLAGSEKSGVEYSYPELFQGSVVILTPGQKTKTADTEKMKEIWALLGAKVFVMTPSKHDETLAYSSHLPHVVAYALAGILKEKFDKETVATGFRDTTRIASSDPALWTDIFISNRRNVLKGIKKYKKILSRIEKDIQKKRRGALNAELALYKNLRDDIFKKN